MENRYNIEDRLIQFSVAIIKTCKKNDYSFAAQHLTQQLIRSATSAALNYGEAQSAQSPKDFLHKMRLSLKEVRETKVNLRIQKDARLLINETEVEELIRENDELIAIFVASIRTSERKNRIE